MQKNVDDNNKLINDLKNKIQIYINKEKEYLSKIQTQKMNLEKETNENIKI